MIKYATALMKNETRLTIDSLTLYFPNINIEELMPALLSIDYKDRIPAKDYIKKKKDTINNILLCNLYIFFLAESDIEESIDELHDYLDHQESLLDSNQPLAIDKGFALNVCKYFRRKEAQVRVYGILELFEEAVKLAIKIPDYELSKRYANKPSDEKLRKKLWIEIAKTIIQNNKDTKVCFDIIKESKILSLVDVLKFLNPKEKLSTFKTDLLHSLEGYGSKIEDIRKEMNEYSKCVQEISDNLKDFTNMSVPISSDQFCNKCKMPLLTNEIFYVFPCLHSFHRV